MHPVKSLTFSRIKHLNYNLEPTIIGVLTFKAQKLACVKDAIQIFDEKKNPGLICYWCRG